MDKKNIPLYVLRSDKDLGGSSIFDPWMGQDHFGRKTLTGILHQELGNEVFSLTRDVSPLSMGKIKVTILDGVKQEFLTSITRFSLIPATFNTWNIKKRKIKSSVFKSFYKQVYIHSFHFRSFRALDIQNLLSKCCGDKQDASISRILFFHKFYKQVYIASVSGNCTSFILKKIVKMLWGQLGCIN